MYLCQIYTAVEVREIREGGTKEMKLLLKIKVLKLIKYYFEINHNFSLFTKKI